MTAPVLVAVVTALAGPGEAVLLAAVLCGAGALAFSLTDASRRWRGEPHEVSWAGPLSTRARRLGSAAVVSGGPGRRWRPGGWPAPAGGR